MSDLGFEFNPDDVPDEEGLNDFKPLPDGEFGALFESCKVETSKNKPGSSWLEIKWKILGPSHVGRIVFDRITLKNESERAQSIGHQQLKKLCAAMGHVTKLRDADVLIGKSANIVLRLKKGDPKPDGSGEFYRDTNKVAAYKKFSGAQGGIAPAQAAAPAATAPWM